MTDIDNTVLFSIQEDLSRLVADLDMHFDSSFIDLQDLEDFKRLSSLRAQLEVFVLEDFQALNTRLFKLVHPLKDKS